MTVMTKSDLVSNDENYVVFLFSVFKGRQAQIILWSHVCPSTYIITLLDPGKGGGDFATFMFLC